MSDDGRKDFLTKGKEEFTPDSAKSTQQKVKEAVTDTTDRVVRGVQPDDQKSATQSAFDKAQRVYDNNNGGASSSIADKVKNALGVGGN